MRPLIWHQISPVIQIYKFIQGIWSNKNINKNYKKFIKQNKNPNKKIS